MHQFAKIMIRGLLVKLLSWYFGVEVPPEYVLGEGSDQEEETPLPPIDRGRTSGEPEGSRTAPRTVEEQERYERLFETPRRRSLNPSERLSSEARIEILRRSYEWFLRGAEPSSYRQQVLEPEASQARASGSGTSSLVPEVPVVTDLPPTPEKPPNPRSCGSKRPREDSDPEADEEV
jgi:hypothetical protein